MANTYSDRNATTLSTLFGRQAVRCSKVCSPVASTDGQDRQFGDDDGGANCSGDFFGRLDSQTNVAFRVPNHDNGLETCALTGASLLLDWFDLWSRRLA